MNTKTVELFVENARKLKKEGSLRLGVTNIIRIMECPMQSIYYSRVSPIKGRLKISKAFVIGSISHLCFEKYYEELKKKENSSEYFPVDLIEVLDKSVDAFSKSRPEEYEYYIANSDEINAQSLKYFRTFEKWTRYNPIPWQRERYHRRGLVAGVLDRIDINEENEIWITDYKTSSSKPKEDLLMTYFSQLGGYCYLAQDLYPNKEIINPRLVVFKNATWNTYVLEDWEEYVEDFESLLKTAAGIIVDVIKGEMPKPKVSEKCMWCLAKRHCKENFQ